MHCWGLHLNNFKGDFLNIALFFCILRFQIFKALYHVQILSYPNKPCINVKIICFPLSDDVSISISKIDTYGPGTQMILK